MGVPQIMAAVGVAQQLFSLFSPKGFPSVSNTQATGHMGPAVQGPLHRDYKSMAEMISNLQFIVENASKTGKLTGDQATQMKNKLDFITQTLNKAQTGSGTQLTPDDLQQIRARFQEIRKELFDALNPLNSTFVSKGVGYGLFKKMDTGGNRAIHRNEFPTFISRLA